MTVCAVVGGQFGSEGKGLIVAHIAKDYGHHARVGAANAGHTFYTEHPVWTTETGGDVPWREKHVMQQLPCAAYANPAAKLWVGPGALISPDIFEAELRWLNRWRHDRGMQPTTVQVDSRAHIITTKQVLEEAASDLAIRIGSTSAVAREGIGAAQADRVMRSADCVLARDWFDEEEWPHVAVRDVASALNQVAGGSRGLLLEGTQGTGLSLTTGEFPYVTSRNTTAAGLAADCGVGPRLLDRIILVVRTFPIRVAGPSGPFARGSDELTWDELGVDVEHTTVTKKVRRVATFSARQVYEAAQLNSATEIALTFADYLDPDLSEAEDEGALVRAPHTREHVWKLEQELQLPVTYIGTGPHHIIDRSRGKA